MNYFPFHVGDYMAHTAHLDDLEDLAYRRMLDAYYLRERALPADPAEVAKLIRMRKHLAIVESVLKEFFVLKDAGWSSERCDAEIAKMQEKQAKAQASSFLGVAARRAQAMTKRLANGQPNGSPDGQPNGHQGGQPNGDLPTPTPTPTPKKSCPDLLTESEPVSEFSIPLVDGTEFQVTERLLGEWKAAYPAVDVPQELREMRTWALANRPKRKTRNGVERFAVAWLGKAQDTPSRAAGTRAAGPDWTLGAQ